MLQWEEFKTCATRLNVPTEPYHFSVILLSDFLTNCLNAMTYRHFHVYYEVLYFRCADHPEQSFFRVIPPGQRHMGALSSQWDGYYLTTFQFSFLRRSTEPSRSVLDNYQLLTEAADLPDTFGGGWLLEQVQKELHRQEDTCFEKLTALFQLLLVELASVLPERQPVPKRKSRNTSDDLRAIYVEYFFHTSYTRPDCSRAQLAQLLGLCERQVVRILDRVYHTTFRDLLLEYRMEAAESRRAVHGLSAEETAALVGYSSAASFRKAYQRYHGHPYERKRDTF